MLRLLIQIGKKILLSDKGEVLIPYTAGVGKSLIEWVQCNFALNVVKIEEKQEWNIIFITAAHSDSYCIGSLISVFAAITKIDESDHAIKVHLQEQQAATNIQLQYGTRNEKIVCISEITEDQRGLKCNCSCPGCGHPLQARLGKKKQHHFAHNNHACDSLSAQQTALHMLAKEIIEEEKRILVPGVEVKRSETSFRDSGNSLVACLPVNLEYKRACVVRCDSVVLEKRVSSMIPDIVINVAGKQCLVEIAVTHFVDDEKSAKAKGIGLPIFEIDISALYGQLIDKAHLRDVLLSQHDNRYWIFNPLNSEAMAWAEDEYHQAFEKVQSEAHELYEKEVKTVKKKQEKREVAAIKLETLFQKTNYKAALEKLHNDTMVDNEFRKFSFFHASGDAIPFFLDIPITGEMIFSCDRRIWQGAIFDRFIFNRKETEDEEVTVHIKKVQKWLTDYQNTFKIDWSLAPKAYVHIIGNGRNFSLIYDVVKQYLGYLSEIGFLSEMNYQEARVKRTHSLIPPNPQKAMAIQNALQIVDRAAPNIDDVISAILHPQAHRYYEYDCSGKHENEARESAALLEKSKANERAMGYQSVQSLDFSMNSTIIDDFGFRWLYCTECSAIKREDEMSSYGGPNKTNLGICRDCSRR